MQRTLHIRTPMDLEALKDRLHLAMESALGDQLDESIAKKVAARLVNQKSWQTAVRQVESHGSNEGLAFRRFSSTPLKLAYNWRRFIFFNEDTPEFDEVVLEEIRHHLGAHHSSMINPNNMVGLSGVDFLERIAPETAQDLVDHVGLSDRVQKGLNSVSFCSVCWSELSPFGRCLTWKCERFLVPQVNTDRPLTPFTFFPGIIHTAHGPARANAAPPVEMMLLETNLIDTLREAVGPNNTLDPAYHPFLQKFFRLRSPIDRVELDRAAFWEWINTEWEFARGYSLGGKSLTAA